MKPRSAGHLERWASSMNAMQVRKSTAIDFEAILAIINDAAQAYRGVIPSDRWHEPYMSAEELAKEVANGVIFWVVNAQQSS